ncbi:MAG: M48 family metallopeptidase [Chitinophagales bacterium]|nr:M48 family metallopeptidase [Chitinophagales bacterium]
MLYKTIEVQSLPVPIKVYVEQRNNSRVALTQKNIIIRLPTHISNDEKNKAIKEHIAWAKEKIASKNVYKHQSKSLDFYQNRTFTIYDKVFTITHQFHAKKNQLSYLGDGKILIYLQLTNNENQSVKIIQKLLIRFAQKYFLQKIINKTLQFNQQYFQEDIRSVKLNYTISKWGSCSSKKDIMFSTKLLLLPIHIIDYVIIHELAHLKEMNHSDKFWILVAKAMPDYQTKDKWLSKHGSEFDF